MSKPDQAFIFNQGKYYVNYPDGGISRVMPKAAANDYAEIFGGTVHKHEYYKSKILLTIKEWIKGVK